VGRSIASPGGYRLGQIHIDVARNSTDDFNPFHDPQRYAKIRGNPYPRPIALGFQVECLCAYLVDRLRETTDEDALADALGLTSRSFQFGFAGAVLRDEPFDVEVKGTVRRGDPPSLSNRVVVKSGGRAVLLGRVVDRQVPMHTLGADLVPLGDLRAAADRAYVGRSGYFLKRKFLSNANAKNFLTGSLVDQSHYFDETAERVRFPELFPCALASCALLEKARSEGHDFMVNPLVYIAHAISIDRRLARALRSNDVLHTLVRGPLAVERPRGLGGPELRVQRFECLGSLAGERLLYRAELDLAPLRAIIAPTP